MRILHHTTGSHQTKELKMHVPKNQMEAIDVFECALDAGKHMMNSSLSVLVE